MPKRSSPFKKEESSSRPAAVAIIGGGCAALTAAFELSKPEHRGRYRVTVYQMGWRLGGKGASGRGAADRIEEHGLHLWMGFYENAFRLMRECYAELGRDRDRCPIATWQDAFQPAPVVAVADRAPGGPWEPWVAHFPPGQGLPGDPLEPHNPFTVRGYLRQAAALLVELVRSAMRGTPADPFPSPPGPESVIEAVDAVLRYGQLLTAAALFEATDVLRAAMDRLFPPDYRDGNDGVLRLIDAIAAAARRQLERVVGRDPALARTWQVVDLILAILRGSFTFGLALDPRGFDAIDDYDWRQWLRMNGASAASLESGFVRGIYDLAFAFEEGDPARPRLAASVALRGAMRMFFTYRGALFWRMSAGMGDVVFAPLYEVLRRRGVRFEFFHRLRDVTLSSEGEGGPPHVEQLKFDVQALVKDGAEYRPLVDVHRLPCWPARPDYAQVQDGERLEHEGWELESPWEDRVAGDRTLLVGRDFDLVILGIGLGAVPMVCSDLVARFQRWRAMVENVKSVATQAFQVWLREDMNGLGWKHPPVNLSGWVEPFDTWADMSHLIPAERFRTRVRSIAYFCSPLPDVPIAAGEALHATQRARVRDNAVRFLDREVSALWPGAAAPGGGFRWDLLAVEPGSRAPAGERRFDTQYWTANVRPSDRYVLSLPGSQKHRLSPLDMTVENLTIAGDWTESGLNTGCVESAVMSGLLAAHALSHSPPLEMIVGYDHP